MASTETVLNAQVSTFVCIGALSTAQELSAVTVSRFPDFDTELIAEESLSLVAALTAQLVSHAARSGKLDAAVEAARTIPFHYRDYFFGQVLLTQPESVDDAFSEQIGQRLLKSLQFYDGYLSRADLPLSAAALEEFMLLWMGKISPKNLPDTPDERLGKIGFSARLAGHCRLISSFVAHCLAP